jgi:phosphoribosylanthranilate isomerase
MTARAVIKICGITNQADADAAVEAGATALGFNFYPASPRYVRPEHAAAIASGPSAGSFTKTPTRTAERIAAIAAEARLDVVQLHGDETPAAYPAGFAVWKAARVRQGFDLAAWEDCPADALLLDGPADLMYGGAGHTFDWRIAAASRRRIVLAGGLDASNVAQAIAQARPWGVDACSRLEAAPGKKDHARMRAFIQAARSAFSC